MMPPSPSIKTYLWRSVQQRADDESGLSPGLARKQADGVTCKEMWMVWRLTDKYNGNRYIHR